MKTKAQKVLEEYMLFNIRIWIVYSIAQSEEYDIPFIPNLF